jgi:hypothetical protein
MRSLGCSLPSGINLNHAWYIERIDSGKRICGNKDDTTVSVYLLLQVSESNCLQNCEVLSSDVSFSMGKWYLQIGHTSRFVEMRQIRKIVAGFEHCWVHQRGQRRIVTGREALYRHLDNFGLEE